jgi:FAD/FMN-containing dehydrogenase
VTLPERTSDETVDRPRFLIGAGGAVMAVAAGYGSSSSHHTTSTTSTTACTVSKAVPRTLQQSIRGHVFERGAPGFETVAQLYNPRFDGILPSAVARPVDSVDVRAAIRYTVPRGVPVRARSGATLPDASCPSVGISGVTLGGGFGLAGRHFGLTADNLVAAQLVTADGTLRTVNATTDPDLLWALKGGGGGNFGIVTDAENLPRLRQTRSRVDPHHYFNFPQAIGS